jgi:hypothetical protein
MNSTDQKIGAGLIHFPFIDPEETSKLICRG